MDPQLMKARRNQRARVANEHNPLVTRTNSANNNTTRPEIPATVRRRPFYPNLTGGLPDETTQGNQPVVNNTPEIPPHRIQHIDYGGYDRAEELETPVTNGSREQGTPVIDRRPYQPEYRGGEQEASVIDRRPNRTPYQPVPSGVGFGKRANMKFGRAMPKQRFVSSSEGSDSGSDSTYNSMGISRTSSPATSPVASPRTNPVENQLADRDNSELRGLNSVTNTSTNSEPVQEPLTHPEIEQLNVASVGSPKTSPMLSNTDGLFKKSYSGSDVVDPDIQRLNQGIGANSGFGRGGDFRTDAYDPNFSNEVQGSKRINRPNLTPQDLQPSFTNQNSDKGQQGQYVSKYEVDPSFRNNNAVSGLKGQSVSPNEISPSFKNDNVAQGLRGQAVSPNEVERSFTTPANTPGKFVNRGSSDTSLNYKPNTVTRGSGLKGSRDFNQQQVSVPNPRSIPTGSNDFNKNYVSVPNERKISTGNNDFNQQQTSIKNERKIPTGSNDLTKNYVSVQNSRSMPTGSSDFNRNYVSVQNDRAILRGNNDFNQQQVTVSNKRQRLEPSKAAHNISLQLRDEPNMEQMARNNFTLELNKNLSNKNSQVQSGMNGASYSSKPVYNDALAQENSRVNDMNGLRLLPSERGVARPIEQAVFKTNPVARIPEDDMNFPGDRELETSPVISRGGSEVSSPAVSPRVSSVGVGDAYDNIESSGDEYGDDGWGTERFWAHPLPKEDVNVGRKYLIKSKQFKPLRDKLEYSQDRNLVGMRKNKMFNPSRIADVVNKDVNQNDPRTVKVNNYLRFANDLFDRGQLSGDRTKLPKLMNPGVSKGIVSKIKDRINPTERYNTQENAFKRSVNSNDLGTAAGSEFTENSKNVPVARNRNRFKKMFGLK